MSSVGQIIARSKGSEFPPFVCFHKDANKFLASIKVDGKSKHLGLFDDPWKAHVVAADYAISNGLIPGEEYAMLIVEWNQFRGGVKNG